MIVYGQEAISTYGHDRIVTRLEGPRENVRVAIYCRVSSHSKDQIHSLVNQITFLTDTIANDPDLRIVGIYIDIGSGNSVNNRPEYQRMLADCRQGKIDAVAFKSISRLGREAKQSIALLQELRDLGIKRLVGDTDYFAPESPADVLKDQMEAAFAEDESRTRSRNIASGIQEQARNGTSSLYSRKCYGYVTQDGELVIMPDEAGVVRQVFSWYLEGKSVLGILAELKKRNILSPTGRAKWCKHSIDTMLSNEKYVGDSLVLKSYTSGYPNNKRIKNHDPDEAHPLYIIEDHHEAIIPRAQFDAVQEEKAWRSNVVRDESGNTTRKSSRYSSKKKVGQE